MSDYKEHPYDSEITLLRVLFGSLRKEQRTSALVLNGYKGTSKEAYEQLSWEDRKINALQTKLEKLLLESYKTSS